MHRPAAVIAAAMFTAGATADEVYQQFAQGNSDLRAQPNMVTGVAQRGVGVSVERYQGWADGNGDLFGNSDALAIQPGATDSAPPNIYPGLGGNPDL